MTTLNFSLATGFNPLNLIANIMGINPKYSKQSIQRAKAYC